MRISWNWLRSLIDTDITPQQAAEVLTSTGLEVESVELLEPVKGMLQGVVVGHVLKREKHPDADRLSVCSVDLGGGAPVGIVCGAANVAEGQKVLVATVSSVLHMNDGSNITIKKSKIRGVESNGMICAEDELGLGNSHDGIIVLDPTAPVGAPAAAFLGLETDHVLEIGLTPNRSDALGHAGVARDLVAALNVRNAAGAKVLWPSVDSFRQDDDAQALQVEVKSPYACPRYAGLTLTAVSVGPSPSWLQDRLKAVGLKPINNVVDVTNYVQHELGQPLHAFDADKMEGGRVVVRHAGNGEPFVALDGKERKLSSEDLVIADATKPACIAGVFGGLASGVTEGTTCVFLESACFSSTSVRRTARRHQLNTDASFRFERGVDPENTVYALKRAALLLKEITGARISSPIVDIAPGAPVRARVELLFERINTFLGTELSGEEVCKALGALDMRIMERSATGVVVDVPPYRTDVTRPVDVMEELVRIIGFDRVPLPARLSMPVVQRAEVSLDGVQQRVSQHLAARGFREAMTPSLVNRATVLKSGSAGAKELVVLQNPLSAELNTLRPDLLHGLMQTAAHNVARQQRDLRLFENGRAYAVRNGVTLEEERCALLLTGQHERERWRADDRVVELPDMKAEVELLMERMGANNVRFASMDHALLQDAVEVSVGHGPVGVVGTVRPEVGASFDLSRPIHYAELSYAPLVQLISAKRTTYAEVPKFPTVRRDLSLLLDRSVGFDRLKEVAMSSERKLLRSVDLFDVYEGGKLPAGKKSYALSFHLLDPTRTLTDDQVDKAMQRIRTAFEKELGAELRG